MPKDPKSYAPTEFQLAFIAESTKGTANTTTMQLMNADVITMPNLNPVIVNEIRTGTGRVRKVADAFICQKGILKTIPFSGIPDTTVLPLLVQNIMTNTTDSGPAGVSVPYNYTPPEILNGSGSGTIIHTLTVAMVSPEGSNSIIFPGCVLTKLTLEAGIDDENGRFKMSGEFQTQHIQEDKAAAPSGLVAYGSTFYYITTLTGKTTFAGIEDCVIDAVNLDLENPTSYSGFNSNGDPDSINRGVEGGFRADMMATIKYDSATAVLNADLVDGGKAALIEVSDNATWSSATNNAFAVKSDNAIISSVAFNERADMYLDVMVEMGSDGSTDDVIELVV